MGFCVTIFRDKPRGCHGVGSLYSRGMTLQPDAAMIAPGSHTTRDRGRDAPGLPLLAYLFPVVTGITDESRVCDRSGGAGSGGPTSGISLDLCKYLEGQSYDCYTKNISLFSSSDM